MNKDEEYENEYRKIRIEEEIEKRKQTVREYNMDKPVLDGQWNNMKDKLHDRWLDVEHNFDNENFLDCIWEISTQGLPGLEVSVVIDNNDRLFISKGTGSFVDYESENVAGMKIPLKCWIHTHPFGSAFFSGIDWSTINKQRFILNSAIVLGNMERMKWYKDWNGEEILCRTEARILKENEEE